MMEGNETLGEMEMMLRLEQSERDVASVREKERERRREMEREG